MKNNSIIKALAVYFTFSLILAFSVPAAAQSKKDLKKAKDLVDQGDKAYRDKNFRDAADQYAKAIVIVPNSPYAHFRNGFALFNLKEYDRAIAEFTMALNQGHKPLEVYRVRSYIYIVQKNYDAAIADIQKGLVIAPADLIMLKGLGEAYLGRNDYPKALEAYKKAVLIDPKDGDLNFNIARVQFEVGDVKAQGAAAQAALTNGTQFMGKAYFYLGDSCQKQRNMPCAIDAYQKAISANTPDSYAVYRSLADIFRNESRFTDAINISKQAILKFPNDGNLYTDVSWYYSLAERSEEAIGAAQSGIRFLPDQYLAYTNLCRAYNDTKQYQLAVTACNSALKLNPKDGETFFYLGRASGALGKKADEAKYYAQAVTGLIDFTQKNPLYSDGFYLLGNAYSSTGQYDKAIDAFGKCLALSPRFVWARFNVGSIQVFKKNKAAAMEQYTNLLAIDTKVAAELKGLIDKM